MKCSHCGAENADNAVYCRSCGQPMKQNQESNPGMRPGGQQWGPGTRPMQPITPAPPVDPSSDVSVGGWVGYQILFSIPLVGFIMTIIFACGAGNNETLKRFSLARLIIIAIRIVLSILFYLLMRSTIQMLIEELSRGGF